MCIATALNVHWICIESQLNLHRISFGVAFTLPLFVHGLCTEFALNWHCFFIDVVLNLQRGIFAASRNFQAWARKFKIAGIQSEATAKAGTVWPSTDAWTSTDIATLHSNQNWNCY